MADRLFTLALTDRECAVLAILVAGGLLTIPLDDIDKRSKATELANRIVTECERVIHA
jgi:hypothetical protein